MNHYFDFDAVLKNFYFKGFNVDSTSALVGTCFVIGIITFLLEGGKLLVLYWLARFNQHPLTYGRTDSDSDDRDVLISSLQIPASLQQIRARRLKYHCLGGVTHVFNLVTGYLIMLAVMTYNVWISIGVITGSGVGYFIFGAIGQSMQKKYDGLNSSIEEVDSNNFPINSGFTEEQHI